MFRVEIDPAVMEELKQKCVKALETKEGGEGITFAEWVTFTYFFFQTGPDVARSVAPYLVKILDTVRPAVASQDTAELVQKVLSPLVGFVNVGLQPEIIFGADAEAISAAMKKAEPELTRLWEAFTSQLLWPKGNDGMGLDIEAGLQRMETAIALDFLNGDGGILGRIISNHYAARVEEAGDTN